MPVDVSMYPQAQPPPNMLTQMSNMAGLVGQMNQNKLFQQQFAAKQAFGNAISANTDKTTGVTNWDAVSAQISHDPRANYLLGEFQQQQLARQLTQLQTQGVQQDIASKSLANLSAFSGSMLANKSATKKDVLNGLADLVRTQQIDPMTFGSAYSKFNSLSDDPAQLHQFLNQLQIQGLPANEQQAAIVGTPGQQDIGGSIIPTLINPRNGTVTNMAVLGPNGQPMMVNTPQGQVSGFAKTLSPGEAAGLRLQGAAVQNVQTPQGIVPVTTAQIATGGIPTGGTPQDTSIFPGQSAPPKQPSQAGQVVPYGAPEAAKQYSMEAAQVGADLSKTAEQVPQRKALLQNMVQLSQDFKPGPNADWTLFAKKFANTATPFGNLFDPSKVASQEDFEKQAQQLINAQETALSKGSDAHLAATTSANLRASLSQGGIQLIGKQLMGNEDAIAAKNDAWQKYIRSQGGAAAAANYSDFSNQFNKNFDPRVFWSKYMTPDEQTKLLSSMSKAEKQKFLATQNWAIQNGY